ncbi:MAG: PilZ domain-containing protein [Gammaproteobacteria bacterium]|nr:PilZ domain-containing protein [Gammaproteobacteria bacterium]
MTDERRRYFRIEDEALVALEPIDKATIDDRLEDFWTNEHAFSLRNNYNFQIEQHIADRNKIDSRMPELGRYLRVLEQQVDLLTDKLLGDENDKAMTEKSVNLSAQGIAYYDDQAPEQDELVELKLKLLPSGFRLVIIARVVLVEKDRCQDQGKHRISLDFENLHEADREILIKHMHNKQMESLSSAQET